MLPYADRYKDKIEYEMDFWVKNGMRIGPGKYSKYLEAFGVRHEDLHDKVLIDVGCGPFGGITYPAASHDPALAIAVDPLFPAYEKAGILKLKPNVMRINLAAEELEPKGLVQMDYVFSCNALDHSPDENTDNTQKAVTRMLGLLKPGGILYLHVHLRTSKELDYGHDFAMTPEKIKDAVTAAEKELGREFLYQRFNVWPDDPINGGKCKTLVAAIQRRPDDTSDKED